jgi:hypothetical protein
MKKIILYIYKKTKYMKKVFAHFKTIQDNPGKFILWFLTSIILSLSTVWLPTLLGTIIGVNYFSKLMETNPFIVFSVVFLSNSVLTAINYKGAGTTDFAVAIRGITLVITFLYLIFLSSIVPLKIVSDISIDSCTQFILLIITILIGVYVYGFRESTWERSVDEVRAQQDHDVNNIVVQAHEINNDGGVAL